MKAILIALVIAVAAALSVADGDAPSAAATTPAAIPADALYSQGRDAFLRGDSEAAADFLLRAAREDRRCLAVILDPHHDALPEGPCSTAAGITAPAAPGDPAAPVLVRLAELDRARIAARPEASELEQYQAGLAYLRLAVRDHGGGPFAARADLELTERSLCRTDAGYPECTQWAIKGYEAWLGKYPVSDQRDRIVRRLAELYLDLADRFLEDRPWRSTARSELCRGRALQLAAYLDRPDASPPDARWARDFTRGIRQSGRSFSIVPGNAIPGRGSADPP